MGLIGIVLQVTGIITPGTPTGFVASNGMAIIVLILFSFSNYIAYYEI